MWLAPIHAHHAGSKLLPFSPTAMSERADCATPAAALPRPLVLSRRGALPVSGPIRGTVEGGQD